MQCSAMQLSVVELFVSSGFLCAEAWEDIGGKIESTMGQLLPGCRHPFLSGMLLSQTALSCDEAAPPDCEELTLKFCNCAGGSLRVRKGRALLLSQQPLSLSLHGKRSSQAKISRARVEPDQFTGSIRYNLSVIASISK